MRTLNDYFITGRVADISTAGSTFVAVPDGGRIIKIITCLQGAISGVAHSGSAVGTLDSSLPTALNRVEEDGTIEIITDGNSTGAKALDVTFIIRR